MAVDEQHKSVRSAVKVVSNERYFAEFSLPSRCALQRSGRETSVSLRRQKVLMFNEI